MRLKLNYQDGFTLVECMIVIAIIGIASAIATPLILNWLPNMRLRAEARNLYSFMQKARIEAVKNNRSTAVRFNAGANTYSFCGDWDSSATPAACNGAFLQVKNFSTVGNGVGYGHGNASSSVPGGTFPSDDISYSGNTLVFNSRGTCNGGYVYLDHQDNTTTYAAGTQPSGVIVLRKWFGAGGWQ